MWQNLLLSCFKIEKQKCTQQVFYNIKTNDKTLFVCNIRFICVQNACAKFGCNRLSDRFLFHIIFDAYVIRAKFDYVSLSFLMR